MLCTSASNHEYSGVECGSETSHCTHIDFACSGTAKELEGGIVGYQGKRGTSAIKTKVSRQVGICRRGKEKRTGTWGINTRE